LKLLLDTHVLLWAAGSPERLSLKLRKLIANPDSQLFFSVASLWEIVIKHGLGRRDFRVDASRLRRALVENGYDELPIAAAHAIAVGSLPRLHEDPFARMLVAQAIHEGLTLVTADAGVARYPASIVTP
jgi:PIN domain nuclease of toxin-antitoxin system